MSIGRKDDRHNEDLAKEIASSFNRAIGGKQPDNEGERAEPPKFVVTGDARDKPKKKR